MSDFRFSNPLMSSIETLTRRGMSIIPGSPIVWSMPGFLAIKIWVCGMEAFFRVWVSTWSIYLPDGWREKIASYEDIPERSQ
ncbi:MAG: hypothetical protein R6U51_10825 [Anaerolineales bacterium]